MKIRVINRSDRVVHVKYEYTVECYARYVAERDEYIIDTDKCEGEKIREELVIEVSK